MEYYKHDELRWWDGDSDDIKKIAGFMAGLMEDDWADVRRWQRLIAGLMLDEGLTSWCGMDDLPTSFGLTAGKKQILGTPTSDLSRASFESTRTGISKSSRGLVTEVLTNHLIFFSLSPFLPIPTPLKTRM